MNGRDKCELLNEIRQKIADENNIEFTIYDCTFEGDCTGTCPKCESELEYLERELEKKQNAGEKINLKNIFTLNQKEESNWDIEPVDDVFGLGEIEGLPVMDDDEEILYKKDLIKKRKLERELKKKQLGEELMGDICPNDLDEDY